LAIGGTHAFWRYWGFPYLPSLADAFIDNNTMVALVSIQFIYYANKSLIPPTHVLKNLTWTCEFPGFAPLPLKIRRGDSHTLALTFPLPSGPLPHSATLKAEELNISWVDIPLCPLPPKKSQIFAGACTQNLVCSYETVARWVAWHRGQGFKSMVIYLNSRGDEAVKTFLREMQPLTENGLLNIVAWQWPKSHSFHEQAASQMSCIYRSRWRIRWLLLNDLDEMVVSESNMTVEEVLRRFGRTSHDDIDGVTACNRWIEPGPNNDYSIPAVTRADIRCTGRGKVIVRPEHTFSLIVHHLSSGMYHRVLHNLSLVNAHQKRWRQLTNTTEYPYIAQFAELSCTPYNPCDSLYEFAKRVFSKNRQ
jgi:hypothetical protein